jgi:RNA polymerase sigma factor (sigma-70 family)
MSQRLHKTFLRQVVALAERLGDTDTELLRRFAERREEAAFAELHRRHGPLVWAVCRQLLPNPADAEDAYQVTFLALVKSAGKVRNGSALGAWLHGVAVRTAARLKRSAARRRLREEKVATGEADLTVPEAAWTGLLATVHEEVERLPASLRTAFVLCDLQGVRQPEAAAQLGWKPGTLTGRLTKERQRLTHALQERGIAPALAAGALGVAVTAAGATLVPAPLMTAVQNYAAGAVDAPAFFHQLAREMTIMRHTKWLVAGLAVTTALGLWLGTFALSSAGGQSSDPFVTGAQDNDALRKQTADRFLQYHNQFQQQPAKSSTIRYKYVPVPEGKAAETYTETSARLEAMAAEGWEFCGTIDMALRRSEYQALLAGKNLDITTGTSEHFSLYRVLVFKQQVQAARSLDRFNPKLEEVRITLRKDSAAHVIDLLSKVQKANPGGTVSLDARNNTLVVTGDKTAIDNIRLLVQELERMSETFPRADVYPVKHVSAVETAKQLSEMFQNKPGKKVRILAHPNTNALLLFGDDETLAHVRRVLEALEDYSAKDRAKEGAKR